MENAEDMELFLLFSMLKFHIFRMFFRLVATYNEWGSRGRRFDSCHSDHRNKGHLVRGVPFFYNISSWGRSRTGCAEEILSGISEGKKAPEERF